MYSRTSWMQVMLDVYNLSDHTQFQPLESLWYLKNPSKSLLFIKYSVC